MSTVLVVMASITQHSGASLLIEFFDVTKSGAKTVSQTTRATIATLGLSANQLIIIMEQPYRTLVPKNVGLTMSAQRQMIEDQNDGCCGARTIVYLINQGAIQERQVLPHCSLFARLGDATIIKSTTTSVMLECLAPGEACQGVQKSPQWNDQCAILLTVE